MKRDFRIAAIVTAYYPASHADVIVSRWLEPRAEDRVWGWHGTQSRIASLFVAQLPAPDPAHVSTGAPDPARAVTEIDLGRYMATKHGMPLWNTVREALTLGGASLAVDAVLLIGEHGEYPFNALRQKLYPRKELFDEIVAVFCESGRVVPLFCDKHLSWNPDWAREMAAMTSELRIPFFAGSSLPHVGLDPPAPDVAGRGFEEFVAVFNCGPEAYGFHSLELMQSLIERRTGGETGIRSITAFTGDGVHEAMERAAWSQELFARALDSAVPRTGDWRVNCREAISYEGTVGPAAFVIQHADGLRSTHILLEGHVDTFAVAARMEGGEVFSGRCAMGGADTFYGHFAALDASIESLFLTGIAPFPPERNLLTTLAVAAFMQALQTPGETLETPDLQIRY